MDFRRLACGTILAALAACGPDARPLDGAPAAAIERSLASGRARFQHAAWGRLLAEGTRAGLVDYRYFAARRADLDAYLAAVGGADLGALSRGELLALLVNAYNACTVRSILDHPGVGTIRDIPGVWTQARHRVGGYDLTLDEIEHRILRAYFKDPRVHFALNCASRSCAALAPWAFEGDRIDPQLEERRLAFLADPRNVRVEAGELRVSRYFDWYGGDFVRSGWVGSAPSLAHYIRRGAAPEVSAFIDGHGGSPAIEFLEFDWSLNSAAD
jgi:uncharacterized protein DUF547